MARSLPTLTLLVFLAANEAQAQAAPEVTVRGCSAI
jgi:hypothetical protein